MIPDYAVLDPLTIRHLPKSIVAATGVDALAHVVECYTSLKATDFSNMFAMTGAKLIFKTWYAPMRTRTIWRPRLP